MAWNDLDTDEMVSLFAPFVEEPEVKKQFLSIKEVAGLYEQVTDVYQEVLSVRPPDVSKDPEYQKLSAAQRPVDYRHDRFVRFVSLTVEAQRERALAQTPPDQDRAAAWDTVFTEVFPDGTRIMNASYRAESGNTLRLKKLLDSPEGENTAALLKTVAVKKGETLLDTVGLWIEAGTELGKLESKKAARLAALSGEPAKEPRVVQAARSRWIAIATLLASNLAVSKAPAKVRNAIGHPLSAAAEKAGKRAASPEEPAGDVTAPEDGATPAAKPAAPEAGKPSGG